MSDRPFVDRYEVLQLHHSASADTIERVYRLLAKRYHPDNQETGDAAHFMAILEAYQTLSDPAKRAAYDATYEAERGQQWRIFDQTTVGSDRDQDRRVFHGILSLLYAARRRDPRRGGLGTIHLEKLLGCPQEHLEFPIWYLKQRGAIEVLDTGQFAITVTGIDQLESLDGGSVASPARVVAALPDPRSESTAA